jgi:Tfp pilus assembly protein PilO
MIGLALAAAIFFMYTQPTYDSVQSVRATISEYDAALDKAAELQQIKQSLLSRYNAFNPSDLERLQKLLPDHVDNVRLVLDLDNLAGQHGMALQNVVISNPASATQDAGAIGNIAAGRALYDSLTLKFATRGSYQTFTTFLQDLETSLRIVDLVSLALHPDGTVGGEPAYRFDITIRTYWLK